MEFRDYVIVINNADVFSYKREQLVIEIYKAAGSTLTIKTETVKQWLNRNKPGKAIDYFQKTKEDGTSCIQINGPGFIEFFRKHIGSVWHKLQKAFFCCEITDIGFIDCGTPYEEVFYNSLFKQFLAFFELQDDFDSHMLPVSDDYESKVAAVHADEAFCRLRKIYKWAEKNPYVADKIRKIFGSDVGTYTIEDFSDVNSLFGKAIDETDPINDIYIFMQSINYKNVEMETYNEVFELCDCLNNYIEKSTSNASSRSPDEIMELRKEIISLLCDIYGFDEGSVIHSDTSDMESLILEGVSTIIEERLHQQVAEFTNESWESD